MADTKLYTLLDNLRKIVEADEQKKCEKCGADFKPAFGEYKCCQDCKGDELTAGEKATHVESVGHAAPAYETNDHEINGKAVDTQSLEIDGVDRCDAPDFCDAYLARGEFVDGTPMSDDELDQFRDKYPDAIWELANGHSISMNAAAADHAVDRQSEMGMEEGMHDEWAHYGRVGDKIEPQPGVGGDSEREFKSELHQQHMKKLAGNSSTEPKLDEGKKDYFAGLDADIAEFLTGDEISDALYDAAYQYYFDNGGMPYGTMKARDGDPHEFIGDRLTDLLADFGYGGADGRIDEAAKGEKWSVRCKYDDPSGKGIASCTKTVSAPSKDAAKRYACSDLTKSGKKNVSAQSATPANKEIKETNMSKDIDDIRKLSGLYKPVEFVKEETSVIVVVKEEEVDKEWANSPNEQYLDTETMTITFAGGPNAPHAQINPNNPGDNPMAMGSLKMNLERASLNLKETTAKLEKSLREKFNETKYLVKDVNKYAHNDVTSAQKTKAKKTLNDPKSSSKEKTDARAVLKKAGMDYKEPKKAKPYVDAHGGDEKPVKVSKEDKKAEKKDAKKAK